MVYSHYDAPGCVTPFTFDSVDSIIDYLKERVPKSKEDVWHFNWYPNGLQIYENRVNHCSILVMDSIANTSEDETKVPKVTDEKYALLANFIFQMHLVVQSLDEWRAEDYE